MSEFPPVDLLLAGGGAMMVFAFAFAAITFDGWRSSATVSSARCRATPPPKDVTPIAV